MNCTICNKKGIPAKALLCPSCGSLMERDEIINAEDEKRAAARELSLLKGKVVELGRKKDRFKQQLANSKIFVYLLIAALVWALFFKGNKKPEEHPITQELRDSLSNFSKDVDQLRNEIQQLKPVREVPKPEPEPELTYHIVKRGDCLAEIADTYLGDYRRYEELAQLNNLSYPYTLKRGQKIKISLSEGISMND